jgi:hypothetical protein
MIPCLNSHIQCTMDMLEKLQTDESSLRELGFEWLAMWNRLSKHNQYNRYLLQCNSIWFFPWKWAYRPTDLKPDLRHNTFSFLKGICIKKVCMLSCQYTCTFCRPYFRIKLWRTLRYLVLHKRYQYFNVKLLKSVRYFNITSMRFCYTF